MRLKLLVMVFIIGNKMERLKKNICIFLVLLVTSLSYTSCQKEPKENLLCSCYIFSTAGKTPHYYLEVDKDGGISLYLSSASDSISYYLSKGKPLPLDSKSLLYSPKDSLQETKNNTIPTRKIGLEDFDILKTNIDRLQENDAKQIFARSKNNPEKIVQIVKKGLTHNGIAITTAKGQYTFWENEGTAEENNILRIIKDNSPIKIILKDQ